MMANMYCIYGFTIDWNGVIEWVAVVDYELCNAKPMANHKH